MKRGNRNNSYERGGQIELAKAMGNVAKKGDKEINEGRENIKSIRKDITSSENQINNLESGIDRETKSIKDKENNIKDIKKDLGGIYKTVQDAKKQKAKFAKGGTVEERVYAIDMRADMYQDEGFFTYNQFKRYADELSDDEFMDEAETQGLVWSSMDGYIMSNEYNEQGAVDSLVERQIPVKMMVAKEYVNPDFLEEGGEVGKTYQIKGADVTFYEDSYEEGEQDQFHSYYLGENDFPYKTKFSNKKDLFETLNDFVSYADMKEEDFYVDEDTIQTSALVKYEKGSDWDEFSAPTEKEIELWKKGEMKLYSAQFLFPYEVYKKEKLEFAKGGKVFKAPKGWRKTKQDEGEKTYKHKDGREIIVSDSMSGTPSFEVIWEIEKSYNWEDWKRKKFPMTKEGTKEMEEFLTKLMSSSYAKGGMTEMDRYTGMAEMDRKKDSPFSVEVWKTKARYNSNKPSLDKEVKTYNEALEIALSSIDDGAYKSQIMSEQGFLWEVDKNGVQEYEKGGKVYAIDIDLENGEQPRESKFQYTHNEFGLHQAKEHFNRLKKEGVYEYNDIKEPIENIQLLEVDNDNDDYRVIDSEFFAKGGEVKKKGNEEHNTMLIGGIAGILLGIFLGRK